MKRPPAPRRFSAAPPVCLVATAPVERLVRFKQLMARDGHFVNLGRMCLDRLYAQDRLARAHGSADACLRAVAVLLFRDYEPAQAARTRR